MEPRLFQHQSQKLILSPQIRQYLRLLKLPLGELEQAVEQEMTENPLLEEKQGERQEDSPDSETSAEISKEKDTDELRIGESYEHIDRWEDSVETYTETDVARPNPSDLQKQKNYQESLITKPEGLSDFLLWQIRFLELRQKERKVAEEIIGNIEEDGYLKAGIEEIAQACAVTSGEVERILSLIQDLDPPGIGARNLQEALMIQLRKKGSEASVALQIVTHHLPYLEKRDWHQLARILAVSLEEVKKAAAIISRLEPKPGRTFYVEEPIAVTPDATISFSEDEDEKFKIEVHDEVIPELRVSPYYRHLLRNKEVDEKSKQFIRDKIQSALNFMKALKLRKSTIREITEEIVKVQSEFFEKGFSHLKPLRLKDIAFNLGVSESTISRALQGKYISTPRGTIPYKSFFSSKLETSNGSQESQKSIMEKIRTMLEMEDPKKPLSDQEISEKFKSEGITVARRTVAKYRELLKILPSSLRRQR